LTCKLALSDVVAGVFVEAVETTRVELILASLHGTANTGGVAPDHLREVAPSSLVGRIVVGVQVFLLVPAVDEASSLLNPVVIFGGDSTDAREVAATAVMLEVLSATIHRLLGSLGQVVVPVKLLSAVNSAPVVVGVKDDSLKTGIVVGGNMVVSAARHIVRGSSEDSANSRKRAYDGGELHLARAATDGKRRYG